MGITQYSWVSPQCTGGIQVQVIKFLFITGQERRVQPQAWKARGKDYLGSVYSGKTQDTGETLQTEYKLPFWTHICIYKRNSLLLA